MPFRISSPIDSSVFGPITTVTSINNVFSQLVASAVLGAIAVPNGVSGSNTPPTDPRYPAIATPWQLATAGVGGAALNFTDPTLQYQGYRLRCAPNAQNLAELNGSFPTRPRLGSYFARADAVGTVFLQTSVDVRQTIVAAEDNFACLVALVSNIPSPGGFFGLYCSSEAGNNWQLAFLSGQAAYNFPFPVPQRLIDTGVPFLNNPIMLRLEAGQQQGRAIINNTTVAIMDTTAPILSANEWTVTEAGVGFVQHRAAKAAGDDTVDLWVGILTGGYIYTGVIPG